MERGHERTVTALGIAAALAIVGALGLAALAEFVDVAAALGRPPDTSREPPGLPPMPERVATFPESPTHLRAMLAARARLRPDRRVLAAVSELSRLHTGASAPASARFDTDRWTVLHGNAVVGPLPETPTFADALGLLASWDAALRRRRAPERAGGSDVPPEAEGWAALDARRTPLVALDRVEAAWARGRRSTALAGAAARGLVALCVATPDAGADLVAGRALAAVAWARAAGADVDDAAALLARRLGYVADARELARALPARNPARCAALDDDACLRDLARGDPAATTLLRGMLAARGMAEAARALPAPPGVGGLLPTDVPAAALPEAVAALEREGSSGDVTPAELDAALPRAGALAGRRTPRGPFLDRALLAARDRAVVADALDRALELSLRAEGPRAARDLVDRAGARAPEPYRDLVAWATHLTRVEDGAEAPETLLRDLAPSVEAPGALLARSARALARGVDRDGPRRRQAHDFLVTHLDTRPSERARLLDAALDEARDRVLADALCASLLASGAGPRDLASLRCVAHAPEALARAAADASLPAEVRARAARWLPEGAEADALRRSLEGSFPGDVRVGIELARGLAGRRLHREALDALAPLADSAPAPSLPEVRATLAFLEAALGDAAAADGRLRSLPAGHRSALACAAEAGVLWRRGRHGEAAARLAARRRELDEDGALGALAAALGADPARARDAGAALGAASPELAAALAESLRAGGEAALAAALLERVEPREHAARLDVAAVAWRARADAGGEAAATAWLGGRVPPALRGALAIAAYRRGADALQWSLVSPEVDDASHREYVWLLRAATALRAGAGDPRRPAVVTHFLGPEVNEYVTLGRYLTGRGDVRAVLGLAEREALRAPVAFYLGARAEAEGRAAEASDWYQLARLVGDPSDREFAWADERLAALARRPLGAPR